MGKKKLRKRQYTNNILHAACPALNICRLCHGGVSVKC